MKRIAIAIIATMISVSVFAKSVSASHVPPIVKSNFYAAYPNAKVIRWAMEGKDYKAEFQMGNDYGSAFYDVNGNFVEGDITVSWTQVPLTGRMEIYHSGANKIINVLKIHTSKNEVFYQVDVRKKHRKLEVLLDKEGNMIK